MYTMRLYALPILSGVLLALVFYPFYFWWLVLVAFVPLFYFARESERSTKELFRGGALVGLIGIGPLVYFSLLHVVPFPQSPLFTTFVQLSSIPSVVVIGALFGTVTYFYARFSAKIPQLFPLVAGALYAAAEATLMWVYQGYYFGSLAHAVVNLSLARDIAAMGGTPLVSFVMVYMQATAVELVWRVRKQERVATALTTLVAAGSLLVLGFAYLSSPTVEPTRTLSVAVLQLAPTSPAELSYGEEIGGVFSAPELEQALVEAARTADLVIYPFSPVEGIVYRGEPPALEDVPQEVRDEAVGAWLARVMPASTTVMLWNTLAESGVLYDEYAFWRAGEKQVYQKQRLYVLSDYMPDWMRSLGAARTLLDIAPGKATGFIQVSGIEISGLICSELHNRSLTEDEKKQTDLLVAVGDDTFFPGSLVANFSLAAAQYYAARYRIPLIRGTLHGPSAIIDAQGAILALIPYGESGILRGNIRFPETPE